MINPGILITLLPQNLQKTAIVGAGITFVVGYILTSVKSCSPGEIGKALMSISQKFFGHEEGAKEAVEDIESAGEALDTMIEGLL